MRLRRGADGDIIIANMRLRDARLCSCYILVRNGNLERPD